MQSQRVHDDVPLALRVLCTLTAQSAAEGRVNMMAASRQPKPHLADVKTISHLWCGSQARVLRCTTWPTMSAPGDFDWSSQELKAQSAAQGRVAMMAAAGVILVELTGLGPWYEAPFKASACPYI